MKAFGVTLLSELFYRGARARAEAHEETQQAARCNRRRRGRQRQQLSQGSAVQAQNHEEFPSQAPRLDLVEQALDCFRK